MRRYARQMVSYGRVVGGHYVNATVAISRKGELALNLGLKKTPNLTADAVAAWQEIISEARGGAAAAMTKVGQAMSLAVLPGVAGKAASAAVGSAADLAGGAPHTVRVDWADGKQSLIQLPDKLFQQLAIFLGERQIATVQPAVHAPAPPPPSMIGQLTKLAGAVRAPQTDVTEQIARLAGLRDQGVLTDWEFEAKKGELLGLAPQGAPIPVAAPPSPPSPPPPPASPATWAPDPHGRYELRYWDGSAWTSHVSTGGVQATDTV